MSYKENGDSPVISMRHISKSFSGVSALTDIDFDVYAGEIHAIVGENGAGKSTLMKILSGAYQPDRGEIDFGDGGVFTKLTPELSQSKGVDIIYQENLLIQSMDVCENIFVGDMLTTKLGFVRKKEMLEQAKEIIKNFGVDMDPARKVSALSESEQQYVKILKAIHKNPRILIMDEPTSMFNVLDAEKVLDLVKKIANEGIAVIYISHFLSEVVRVADRITVLRDGRVTNTYFNGGHNTDIKNITQDMVGRSVEMFYDRPPSDIGEVVFETRDLKLTKDSAPVSFKVHRGEILGFSGMVGSGRTEIMNAIAGASGYYSGEFIYKGSPYCPRTPSDALQAGIGYVTEDRQNLGLSLAQSVQENIMLPGLKDKKFFFNYKSKDEKAARVISIVGVKTTSYMQEIHYLSGGNQQKVVIGKWLYVDSELYIFDEPTRGIDVNAKAELYSMLSKLTKEGKSILLISSDMPELISMSDRVLVVRNGRITRELTGDQINEQQIIAHALGVSDDVG